MLNGWSFSIDLPRRGGRANGCFPKGARRLSEKPPAGYPPPHHREDTPRERGRPARILSLGLPLSFPAMLQPATLRIGPSEAEPWRFCPVIQLGEMPRLCQVFYAGGTPALPGGLHPITSSHPRRSIVLRVYSCSFVVRLQKQSAVSSSNDPPTGAGAGLALSEYPVVVPVAHPGPDGLHGCCQIF